jgi:prophage regulatory protein
MPASPVRLVVPAPELARADEAPKLLTLPQVCRRIGLGRSKVYGLIQAGAFPRPVKIGSVSRWATRQVDAWVEQQIAQSEV